MRSEDLKKYNISAYEIALYSIFFLSIALGIFARFKGLDRWPLSNADEYFFAKSVKQIIKHGVPLYETGGYYTRGVIQQYFSAFLIVIGLKDELALRLITVICNLIAIPAIYLLGKKIAGKNVAIGSVIIFSLSVWEIEMARFVRMYAPFQMLFIWYIYFLYKVIVENDIKSMKWMYILSFVGIFTYAGGIFPVILNFLPIILKFNKKFPTNFLKNLIVSLLLFIFAYLYMSVVDFRNIGVTNTLPSNIFIENYSVRGTIDYPNTLLAILPNIYWTLTFTILLFLTGCAIYMIFSDKYLNNHNKLGILLLLICAVLNLFGMLAYILVLLILLNWLQLRDINTISYKLSIGICTLFLIYWLIFLLTNQNWYNFFPDFVPEAKIRKLLIILVDYPYVYDKILNKYLSSIPQFTIMATILIGFGFTELLIKSYSNRLGYRILFFLLILHILFVGMLNTPFKTTRYTFFLFPLVLILVVTAIKILSEKISRNFISRKIIFIILIGVFLVLSEDFNLRHILNIDSKEVNYRIIYGQDTRLAKHYYQRNDIKTPAEVINENIKDDDLVLSIFLLEVDYYLNQLDYVYRNSKTYRRFYSISRLEGQKELWTNADLIYNRQKLFDFLNYSDKTIWVIAQAEEFKDVRMEENILAESYSDQLFYTNIDRTIKVYKITPENKPLISINDGVKN